MKKITEEQIGQLAEVVNIGAGNAATAMSHMIGKGVDMTVPFIHTGAIEDIHNVLGDTNEVVVNVFFRIHGDMEGAMLLIFNKKDAVGFANMLTKSNHKDIKDFQDEDLSALQEVGNILLGASVTALGKFLDMNLLHSIPDVSVDMLGASLDEILVELDTEGSLLLFEVDLTVKEAAKTGKLYFLFDPKSSKTVLEKTQEKLGA
ncbi:MAG: chemotaxis protein CheC [Candidatus Magasanikbacteria bacterium]|jgi:chemotaxis protein CheC|nr:chemotaxis protein CheC [Candidatus Magasanikbacteria bacterium]